MNHQLTVLDYFKQTGIFGSFSVAVFLVGIAFGGWIHFRKLGLRYRIALIPFSLLPLMIGICGLAVGVIQMIHEISKCGVRPDAYWLLGYFSEVLLIIPLTTIETAALLLISCLLFIGRVGMNRGHGLHI